MPHQRIFYFSGVHATGKTSVIRQLRDYLADVVLIDLDQYYHYPKDIVNQQMKRIHIGYETWANTHAPLLLVDRGPYDALLYTETFYEFGKITRDDFDMIHDTFHMLPADYRDEGYIIFLNPSFDRIMANIKARGRDNENGILGDPDFVKALHDRFSRFYDQIQKVRHVAIFTNEKEEYSADSILLKLQQLCWLQPYEIRPEKHIILDKFGLYQKNKS